MVYRYKLIIRRNLHYLFGFELLWLIRCFNEFLWRSWVIYGRDDLTIFTRPSVIMASGIAVNVHKARVWRAVVICCPFITASRCTFCGKIKIIIQSSTIWKLLHLTVNSGLGCEDRQLNSIGTREGTYYSMLWVGPNFLTWRESGEGRTRLPRFKFSAKFPIGFNMILQLSR